MWDFNAGFGRVQIFSDFLGAVIDPAFTGVSENSGTAALVVAQENGVVGLITGTTSTNRSLVATGLNHKGANGGMQFEARVAHHTAITTRGMFVGLTDNVAIELPIAVGASDALTTNATDAVGFAVDTAGSGKWIICAVKNDVDGAFLNNLATPTAQVVLDGSVMAPVADTFDVLRLYTNTDGDAVFEFGRTSAGKYGTREVGRMRSCFTPAILLSPEVCNITHAASAVTTYVDYMFMQSSRGLV